MKRKAPRRVAEVVVLTTAMLTFISFWRAAAIVLCDMASTAWYIGGISERAIGPAAPWFILAVMSFSACMLALYVEASSMFVRGGVYKVVRRAMGSQLAKIAVSALMFDYILTGAISSVSAGQYLAGLINTTLPHIHIPWRVPANGFSVIFAIAAVLWFWRENIHGIEESSDTAAKIMKLVAVMGGVLLLWGGVTWYLHGGKLPSTELKFSEESLGWLHGTGWEQKFTMLALAIGLGHAFLGMSGLESLAQVYREMEAPKLANLKKAAVLIFLTAFILTVSVSFFAVGLIPDDVRVAQYADNLLAGLALSMAGPHWAQMLLQAFVVLVGVLILCGAVNTSIVGSNGVLNRLAEDGIMPDFFRWLHPRYGTTHRMIHLIVVLQIIVIAASGGHLYLLGEAYAFGVIWSFVFMSGAIIVLRFTDTSPREWMVPFNVKIGKVHVPLGLAAIFLVLAAAALVNLVTKRVATISGLAFTACFYGLFAFAERFNTRKGGEAEEKLNLRNEEAVTGVAKHLDRPSTTLVAVRDHTHLLPLQRALETFDPETTELVACYCKVTKGLGFGGEMTSLGPEENLIFTRVISMAEKYGKTVVPLLVTSNEPFYAISHTAQELGAAEVVIGVSGRVSMEVLLERLAMTMGAVQTAAGKPVKVRIVGADKEMTVEF